MNGRGIYCLVFQNPAATLRVGSLGDIEFSSGWHIYVGSALGNAGFSRVGRHILLSKEKNKKPRWHVDHLLLSADFKLTAVYCGQTVERLECVLADAIGGECVKGFGCSDCSCSSHLFYREEDPSSMIMDAFSDLKVPVQMKNIK